MLDFYYTKKYLIVFISNIVFPITAKHAAAKLRTGFTPEETAKLKQILALRKDEVDHLPIPELRQNLVFLKVVHTFDMPVETLRDMLWRNIVLSKS